MHGLGARVGRWLLASLEATVFLPAHAWPGAVLTYARRFLLGRPC